MHNYTITAHDFMLKAVEAWEMEDFKSSEDNFKKALDIDSNHDEIWFAQKNQEGSTQLYSLSDFNVHSTANIENGYLNGRYGGIPFLTNLKDLHWEYGQK